MMCFSFSSTKAKSGHSNLLDVPTIEEPENTHPLPRPSITFHDKIIALDCHKVNGKENDPNAI